MRDFEVPQKDDGEVDWDAYNAEQKKQKQENHNRAMATLEEAKKLAKVNGFILFQHGPWHFSLTCLKGGERLWRINLYPSNQRIWADKKCGKAPFLEVPAPWNFLDVVSAAIIQNQLDPVKKAMARAGLEANTRATQNEERKKLARHGIAYK